MKSGSEGATAMPGEEEEEEAAPARTETRRRAAARGTHRASSLTVSVTTVSLTALSCHRVAPEKSRGLFKG
jgi:hypothetical protein